MNSNLFILRWERVGFIATALKDYGFKSIDVPGKIEGIQAIHIQTLKELRAIIDPDHPYLILGPTVMDLYENLAGNKSKNNGNNRYDQLSFLWAGGGRYNGVFHTNLSCPWVQMKNIRERVDLLMER